MPGKRTHFIVFVVSSLIQNACKFVEEPGLKDVFGITYLSYLVAG